MKLLLIAVLSVASSFFVALSAPVDANSTEAPSLLNPSEEEPEFTNANDILSSAVNPTATQSETAPTTTTALPTQSASATAEPAETSAKPTETSTETSVTEPQATNVAETDDKDTAPIPGLPVPEFDIPSLGNLTVDYLEQLLQIDTAKQRPVTNSCWRENHIRQFGLGRPIHVCEDPEQEQSGLLCYPKCEGARGFGPLCVNMTTKKSTWRGIGVPLGCSPEQEKILGLCYKKCPIGSKPFMRRCIESCPSFAPVKCTFSFCTRDHLSCASTMAKVLTSGWNGIEAFFKPDTNITHTEVGDFKIFELFGRESRKFAVPTCKTLTAQFKNSTKA